MTSIFPQDNNDHAKHNQDLLHKRQHDHQKQHTRSTRHTRIYVARILMIVGTGTDDEKTKLGKKKRHKREILNDLAIAYRAGVSSITALDLAEPDNKLRILTLQVKQTWNIINETS
eukprot:g46136.t1